MNYTRRVKLWVAILLSGCFLVVSSGLASSPETHIHDGHHHQQTHGKTWCSWTCQAGNGLQGFTPLIPKCCFHIVPVHQDNPPIPHLILFIQRSSRAPPASLSFAC